VEAELATLAASGATTLVGLMVTDAWGQVRSRVTGLFRRGPSARAVDADLEESRQAALAAVAEGDLQGRADIEAEWRSRLRRLLLSDPEVAHDLRALVQDAATGPGAILGGHASISGGTFNGPVLNMGTQINHFRPPVDGD